MPNIRSSKKRMRQAARQREHNRAQRSTLRSAIRKVRTAASLEDAQAAYRRAERLLDRAAGKGLIARNTAARHKRRLHKVVTAKAG